MTHRVEWCYLGHAMWLLSVGQVRILFDPLLGDTHQGGVFETRPRRRIDETALRPDFIVVSHRHPDHFDVASLARLARLDDESVVLTSDALVERCARRLGFRTVARFDALHTVSLEGATLLSTPSFGSEIEWGMMVATDDGVAWNQVDSVMRDAGDVRRTLAAAAQALARPSVAEGVALGLVRWQPLREIEAVLAGDIGFPMDAYGQLLDAIAALGARAVVPASAGVAHTAPHAWMNQLVYPVPEARLLRDLAARCPDTDALGAVVGGCYRVEGGAVVSGEPVAWVEVDTVLAPQAFAPLAIPALWDPNLDGRDEAAMRAEVRRWIESSLMPAIALARADMRGPDPLRLSLEVVWPSTREGYTIVAGSSGVSLRHDLDDDHDVLNQIAGSQLCDVIAGRRHWGEPLLGGWLRASVRAYAVDRDGLRAAAVAPIFLYYALSYPESQERWIEGLLATSRP